MSHPMGYRNPVVDDNKTAQEFPTEERERERERERKREFPIEGRTQTGTTGVPSPLYSTGWRRLMGCLKLQVICKRATNYRAFLRKMTYEDKASYGSSPPCM